jgi:hypothetical protein
MAIWGPMEPLLEAMEIAEVEELAWRNEILRRGLRDGWPRR